jgi:BASS family bile acid:Na+ symporter
MSLPPAGTAPLTAPLVHALIAAYLVTMMGSMGLELGAPPGEDKPARRHQRRLLVRGLVVNLLLLPAVAMGVIHALPLSDDFTVALVLLAVAPGGRFAPQLTRFAGGELALSVELSLFLVKLTAFTAPATAKLMLGGSRIDVPELRLILQLILLQIAPYYAGRLLRRRRERLATRLGHLLRAVSLVCVALIVAYFLFHRQLRSLLLLGPRDWLALMTFACAGLALAWLVGGTTPRARRAVAVSANARDLALALVMADVAFRGSAVTMRVLAAWLALFGFDMV